MSNSIGVSIFIYLFNFRFFSLFYNPILSLILELARLQGHSIGALFSLSDPLKKKKKNYDQFAQDVRPMSLIKSKA